MWKTKGGERERENIYINCFKIVYSQTQFIYIKLLFVELQTFSIVPCAAMTVIRCEISVCSTIVAKSRPENMTV